MNLLAISSVSECIIAIDILRCLQNSHIDSLTCGVRAIKAEKAKWRPLELPLIKKRVNQNQYHILGGTAEISAIMKDLKGAGVVVPTTFPFPFCIWPVGRPLGSAHSLTFCCLEGGMVRCTIVH